MLFSKELMPWLELSCGLKWDQQKQLARMRKPLPKGTESLAWVWLHVQLELMVEYLSAVSVSGWYTLLPALQEDTMTLLNFVWHTPMYMDSRLGTAYQYYDLKPEGSGSPKPRVFKRPNNTGGSQQTQ